MLGSPVLFRIITSFSAAAQISADIPLLFRSSQASFTFLNLRRRSSRSLLSRTFITNLLSEQAEEQILTVTLCSPFSSAKQDSAYSSFYFRFINSFSIHSRIKEALEVEFADTVLSISFSPPQQGYGSY